MMKLTKTLGTCLLAVLLLSIMAAAGADGMMVPRQNDWDLRRERSLITEPAQKAVIYYKDGKEQLIISPSYQGPASDFAWVVPVPARPHVKVIIGSLFHELAQIVEPEPVYAIVKMMAGSRKAENSKVIVLERRTVGAYDVSVLAASDPLALQSWLRNNGYYLPQSAMGPLSQYVREHWTFVASRIKTPRYARGLQTGELAPLSLTFKCQDVVYPMRLSSVNPARFDLLLYVLSAPRRGHLRSLRFPLNHEPVLKSASVNLDQPRSYKYPSWYQNAPYPTLHGLGADRLQIRWLKTVVSPADCTRDYVWTFDPAVFFNR